MSGAPASDPIVDFEITLTTELASKKNNKVPVFKRGRLVGLIENATVRKAERAAVRQMRDRRMGTEGPGAFKGPLFPKSQSLALVMRINRDTGETFVRVDAIAREPKRGKNGRKRDAQNELGLVCDALEKAGVCENDNQFARILLERVVQGEVR